ncbi:beta-phosphoglucomutase family hydrolase [Prauserella halophila]|uniref:Beta-phosphoglucomutase n=1 Tax=Prauserella halophila TaxID=185641 RepID=A0ABN1W485_9PSEU|nr:beta-phosphoglucomutase family hydrolase [Prauserella halophila]MCP2236592.1 haloacid dehalogenase superfamily, subfamily IA, variant 3 with third motif having DD or ED/beta-phosphoglucomutase family hydrolase [Prauserella halophila]
MIGLPAAITACLFDLDGVLTSTASVHRTAWRRTFDELLARRGHAPFTDEDYTTYLDGRSRLDGVRAFLASRDLDLPEGTPDDPTDTETVHGIGARKNALVLRLIDESGVTPFPGSVRYLTAARAAGLAIGVVTSSANAAHVLGAAGLDEFVQARVDGKTITREGLRGKPAPDAFLACAGLLGAAPAAAAVFEDALAGVEAGRAGGFGHVVGVDRAGQAAALAEHGADVVVRDLADLLEVPP